jgi:hypothetical protein
MIGRYQRHVSAETVLRIINPEILEPIFKPKEIRDAVSEIQIDLPADGDRTHRVLDTRRGLRQKR